MKDKNYKTYIGFHPSPCPHLPLRQVEELALRPYIRIGELSCPSPTVALRRVAPTPPLGSTVEQALKV